MLRRVLGISSRWYAGITFLLLGHSLSYIGQYTETIPTHKPTLQSTTHEPGHAPSLEHEHRHFNCKNNWRDAGLKKRLGCDNNPSRRDSEGTQSEITDIGRTQQPVYISGSGSKVVQGGHVVIEGSGNVVVNGRGYVEIRGSGSVVINGGGYIVKQGSGSLTINGDSKVFMSGSGNVVLNGNGSVHKDGSGSLTVTGDCLVKNSGSGSVLVRGRRG